jgi:Ice-binding-like
MKFHAFSILALALALPLATGIACADSIDIGTAAPYAVLGEAGVTNTGSSVIFGSVAGSTGTPAVTGFPVPGTVIAPGVLITTGVANAGPGTPFGDAAAAYGFAAGLSVTTAEGTNSLGAGGVGASSSTGLTPGVYSFASAAGLNGTLFLNAGGSNAASWTFLIPSMLTTASASDVVIENAGTAGSPYTGAITWDVGSGATLGAGSTFLGTLIANTGTIALDSTATIGCGRAVALTGSVTLIGNVIDIPGDCSVTATGTSTNGTGAPTAGGGGTIKTPEPGELALLSFGLAALAFLGLRKSRARSATI